MEVKEVFKGIHENCGKLGICSYNETGCGDCPVRITLIKAEEALDRVIKQESVSEEKLLGCPICDGEAIYLKLRYDGKEEVGYCKCAKGCVTQVNPMPKLLAIRNWNERKPMDRVREQLIERMEDVAGYSDDDIFLGEYRAYKGILEIMEGGVADDRD